MKRSNSIIGTELVMGPDGQTVAAITFHVKGAGSTTLDLGKVHVGNMRHAAIHGFIQRVSDAAAIARDPKTGQAADPEDKLEAMERLVEHYNSGSEAWTRVREAGPKGGLLFEALCRMYGHQKAPSEIREWLDGLDDKTQAALREDADVAAVIADIKRERAKDEPKVDTKSILAGLKA